MLMIMIFLLLKELEGEIGALLMVMKIMMMMIMMMVMITISTIHFARIKQLQLTHQLGG